MAASYRGLICVCSTMDGAVTLRVPAIEVCVVVFLCLYLFNVLASYSVKDLPVCQ